MIGTITIPTPVEHFFHHQDAAELREVEWDLFWSTYFQFAWKYVDYDHVRLTKHAGTWDLQPAHTFVIQDPDREMFPLTNARLALTLVSYYQHGNSWEVRPFLYGSEEEWKEYRNVFADQFRGDNS